MYICIAAIGKDIETPQVSMYEYIRYYIRQIIVAYTYVAAIGIDIEPTQVCM